MDLVSSDVFASVDQGHDEDEINSENKVVNKVEGAEAKTKNEVAGTPKSAAAPPVMPDLRYIHYIKLDS
jgi:hypothetical protein